MALELDVDFAFGLGAKLRRTRRHLDMSQAEIARLAGIAQNSVGRYERGEMIPSALSLARLLIVLQADVYDLLSIERPVRKTKTGLVYILFGSRLDAPSDICSSIFGSSPPGLANERLALVEAFLRKECAR